jgi:SAM-dependent methyltransferase
MFGHDFIGTEIRLAHFLCALRKIPYFQNGLDAGCGTGDFSFYVAHKYKNATIDAVDIDKNRIEENNRNKVLLGIPNVSFFEADILNMQGNRNKEKKRGAENNKRWKNYDFVFCIGTILYFTKKQRLSIAQNLMSLVKPGGHIYFDLPINDYNDLSIIPTKYYPNMYKLIEAKNTGDLFGFEELEKLLKKNNFTVIYKNKTHNYVGKFAWEFDNVLRERNLNKLRLVLLPLLRFLARVDAWTNNKQGCCFCILAKKNNDENSMEKSP